MGLGTALGEALGPTLGMAEGKLLGEVLQTGQQSGQNWARGGTSEGSTGRAALGSMLSIALLGREGTGLAANGSTRHCLWRSTGTRLGDAEGNCPRRSTGNS